MINNDSYLKNTKDTYSRFSMAWTAVDTARNKMSLGGIEAAIRGENSATASGRQPLGQEMKDLGESIIQTINGAKYGEHFVFSGADGLNAPFTWSEDMKTLYYRARSPPAGKRTATASRSLRRSSLRTQRRMRRLGPRTTRTRRT